jgi:hypothetical protein
VRCAVAAFGENGLRTEGISPQTDKNRPVFPHTTNIDKSKLRYDQDINYTD